MYWKCNNEFNMQWKMHKYTTWNVISQLFLKMSENFMDVFWISKIVYGLFPVIINVFFYYY